MRKMSLFRSGMIPFCKVTTFFFSLFLLPMENFYNFHFHKYQRIIGIRKVGLIDLWKIFVPTMENGSESHKEGRSQEVDWRQGDILSGQGTALGASSSMKCSECITI